MGQAECPLTFKNSPISVILFGLDMIRATHDWSRSKGANVTCRVGVHHGACIGGIVGTEMQRYHLFGEFIGQLDTLEATAPEGKAQVSVYTKMAVELEMEQENIPKEVVIFMQREEARLTTSKGEVHDYDEIGGRTYVVRSYAH